MKFSNALQKKISKAVVKIIAEDININWQIPYKQKTPRKGHGTGFFINDKGYILTCAHVICNSKNIYIEIPSIGTQKIKCDIIGFCPHFDIALIRTQTYKSKYFLNIGNSDTIKVGDQVYVVGYPASSFNSTDNLKYTIGIISGQQSGLIQTDSAINPGNSGGPMFLGNKVIGINSQKIVDSSIENVGFSTPINYYKVIKANLFRNTSANPIIHRPSLLFSFNNTDIEVLKAVSGEKVKTGIIVSKINEKSILHKSKIKEGTIITEINGYKINNYGLTDKFWIGTQINIDILLNLFSNNSDIKIKYYNIGQAKSEISKFKLAPYVSPVRELYPVFEEVPYFILAGMIFMNLSLNHFEYISRTNYNIFCLLSKLKDVSKPVLFISFVFPNSKINILNNLKTSSIIKKINDIEVLSLDDLKKAIFKPIKIYNKEYITVEDDSGKSAIMSIDEIIKQDILFSKTYKYPLNDFHKKYM